MPLIIGLVAFGAFLFCAQCTADTLYGSWVDDTVTVTISTLHRDYTEPGLFGHHYDLVVRDIDGHTLLYTVENWSCSEQVNVLKTLEEGETYRFAVHYRYGGTAMVLENPSYTNSEIPDEERWKHGSYIFIDRLIGDA
jgi:hypothetical protein